MLQGLMTMHSTLKPEPLQKLLCGHGFHTTRREITNFRERKRQKQKA